MNERVDIVRHDRSFAVGWVVVLLISAFLGLSALYVLLVPVDESFFQDATGQIWEDFATANPGVAQNIERENRLLGISGAGLALFAFVVAWSRLRRAERWAAAVLWILPLALAGYTVLFVIDGIVMLALFYGPMTIAAAAGLSLVARALRGQPTGLPEAATTAEST